MSFRRIMHQVVLFPSVDLLRPVDFVGLPTPQGPGRVSRRYASIHASMQRGCTVTL